MISLIFSLFILLISSASLSVITKRRIEECFPLNFGGVIFILYFFYIAGALLAGRIVLYAAILALFVIALRKIISTKDKEIQKEIFERIATPALLVFAAMAIFFIVFAYDMKPSLWDELRLWAAYPKALHFSPHLQVGEGALLFPTMQSYPPGMALFIYFLTALSKTYSYGSAFAAYWIFAAALFMPALKKISWRRWLALAPVFLILLCFPLLLTINSGGPSGDWAYYYGSMFIEAVLGCTFGHALYMAVKDPFGDLFALADISLILFIMPLFKNAGAMYGIFVVIVAVVIAIIKKEKLKKLIYALIPLAAMALTYFSWQLIINTKGTGEFIDFNISNFTLEKAGNVLTGLTSWGKIPIICFFIFFILADVLITLIAKDISKKSALVVFIAFAVCLLIFLYGYTSHYGLMISSVHRYTQVFTFAAFYYLFMRLMASFKLEVELGKEEVSEIKEISIKSYFAARRKIGFARMLVVQLLLGLLAVVIVAGLKGLQYKNKTYKDSEKIKAYVEEELKDTAYSAEHPARVYLALGGDIRKESQRHETYALELIGTKANVQSIWCDKIFNEAVDGVVTDKDEAARIWKKNLDAASYEYVLIAHPDDDIKDAANKALPNLKDIRDLTLYEMPGH